ncbi:beta-phosphoglucomutase [Clostridium sp. DL1XJH146]
MANIKACIFDLDGVIVDTAKYHFLAWEKLSDELGINFTLEDNERLKGVSRMRSLEIILEIGKKYLSKEDMLKYAAKKNEWYKEYITKMTPNEILPGAKEFLQVCKDNGIKTALGSASKNSMLILKKLNLVDYFDAIIDGTKVSNAKPDPEVFLKGAKELDTKPEFCLVFEDAQAGVEAAKNAKMYCVGIGSKDLLSKADIIIDGLHKMTLDKFYIL